MTAHTKYTLFLATITVACWGTAFVTAILTF